MNGYTICVMDYESGSLRFYYFNQAPENPEEWLATHDRQWHTSGCYWMGVDGNGIDEDHIYNADDIKSFDEQGCEEEDDAS